MRRRRLLASAPGLAGALIAGCERSEPETEAAWRGPVGDQTDPRLAILAWSILAPSPWNTQPWQVVLAGPDGILLRADAARRLPASDPDGRQERVALGCFVELGVMAAAARGHRLTPGAGGPELQLQLRADPAVGPDPLFAAVRRRRTSRRAFDLEKPVTATHARMLADAVASRATVGFLTEPRPVAAMRELVSAARVAGRTLPGAAAEHARWLRLGPDEAATHGDGIVLGGPWLGLLRRAGAVSAELIVADGGAAAWVDRLFWQNLFAGTASFGWLATAGDDPAERLAAGRAYQRLDLAAAAAGVALHPVSEALGDVPELGEARLELERQLGVVPPARVQMLFRLGYAGPQPPSPRRDYRSIIAKSAR
jgi:hypothetical protein